MSLGVECLLSDDPAAALAMARELDALNRRRREIETAMREEAEVLLDRVGLDGAELPPGLCLFAPGWHQGVTGILAARIRERYHRPVIAFGEADDGRLRGSARSLDGLHMRDLIAAVDGRHPGLIERFGGHAMAAGLTLDAEALEAFRAAFEAEVRRELGDDPPRREILSDGELPPAALSLPTAEVLRLAGPWGKGFPEPVFDGRFGVEGARVVGGRHLKLRLRAAGGPPVEAIAFGQGPELAVPGAAVHLAYRLDVNEYQGSRTAQLIVEHLQPAGPRPQS
jgi:single-stranded-DNA-specific exonuclease